MVLVDVLEKEKNKEIKEFINEQGKENILYAKNIVDNYIITIIKL